MAAPTPSNRNVRVPAGIPLQDGYQTLITFATAGTTDFDVCFWEKAIKPPGIDGGEPINMSSQLNEEWHTKTSRSLKDLTPSTVRAGYDPNCYSEIKAMINVETTITIHFPDGSTLAFYGYLQKFEADDLVEGTNPECTLTVVPTNWDPVEHIEAGPTFTNVVGT